MTPRYLAVAEMNPGDGTQVMRAGRGFVRLLPVTTVVFLHGVGGAMPGVGYRADSEAC